MGFQLSPSLTSAASPSHDNAQAVQNLIHVQNPLFMTTFFACIGLQGIQALWVLGHKHEAFPLLTAESLCQPTADVVLGKHSI